MGSRAEQSGWVACHECDLLLRREPLGSGQRACCSRCGAVLYEHRKDALDQTLALTLAGLVLFVMAHCGSFMTFTMEGRSQAGSILSGVLELFDAQFFMLGALLLLVIFIAPLSIYLGLLYVLLPLRLGLRLPLQARVLQASERLRPWAMLEVYLLGSLVALVKLGEMAALKLEPAFWALLALVLLTAWATASLDSERLFERLETGR
ncbi:MAG: paraquat-inducible protein A [Planctomycetota bacterium]